MTDKIQKKVYLPEDLADVLDAHPRTNSDLAESALEAYLHSGEVEDVERRLDELERRKAVIESERNERNRKLQEIDEERETLEKRRERLQDKRDKEEQQMQTVIERLDDVPRDPDNPAIKTQADNLNMEPMELIDELPERDGGDLNSL